MIPITVFFILLFLSFVCIRLGAGGCFTWQVERHAACQGFYALHKGLVWNDLRGFRLQAGNAHEGKSWGHAPKETQGGWGLFPVWMTKSKA
jgi:hypothetical protein